MKECVEDVSELMVDRVVDGPVTVMECVEDDSVLECVKEYWLLVCVEED